jgi:hypothetical protein
LVKVKFTTLLIIGLLGKALDNVVITFDPNLYIFTFIYIVYNCESLCMYIHNVYINNKLSMLKLIGQNDVKWGNLHCMWSACLNNQSKIER